MSTPAEVYAVIRNQCAESGTDFWGESEIYSLMSMGEHILAHRLGVNEASTSFSSVTNTKTYSIASSLSNTSLGVLTRVTYDSYRLQAVDINEFDNIEGMAYGGVTVTGKPEYYYRYGDTLGFSPTPDESKVIALYHQATPAKITTASTAFTVPDEYTDYIADYALYRMFLKDQELQNEAIIHKKQWDENLVIISNNWTKTRNRDRVPTVRIYEPLVDE